MPRKRINPHPILWVASLLLLALAAFPFIGALSATPDRALAGDRRSPEGSGVKRHAPAAVGHSPERRATPRQPPRPAELIKLPESVDGAILVDLQRNQMHVFRRQTNELVRARELYVSIGKNGTHKQREGDEKTPVGIYFISSYIPGSQLPEIYGAGALPLNYPNHWDRRMGRTGSGIWIHGTDKTEESLVPQSSRGCLTLMDPDFHVLSEDVQIKSTPTIVAGDLTWQSPETIEQKRQELLAALGAWERDWESLDVGRYLSHYSTAFRADNMDIRAFSAHKKRVAGSKKFIRLDLSEIGIYGYPDEGDVVLITFRQQYRSNNFNSEKWKHQYWRREDDRWRIVQEGGA